MIGGEGHVNHFDGLVSTKKGNFYFDGIFWSGNISDISIKKINNETVDLKFNSFEDIDDNKEYVLEFKYFPEPIDTGLRLFSTIYLEMESLENGFLFAIKPHFFLSTIGRIVSPEAGRWAAVFDEEFCLSDENMEGIETTYYIFKSSLDRYNEINEIATECVGEMRFVGKWPNDQTSYLIFDLMYFELPINFFMLTSFSSTMLIYFMYILVLVGRIVYATILRDERYVTIFMRRHPFGFFGLLMGIVLAILNQW